MAATAVITVQVRELVEFVLRRGDLSTGRDFSGPGRALAGIRGHQRIQRARPAGYQKEVRLSRAVEAEGLVLRVQGRIDGLMEIAGEVVIEEIKTVRRGWQGKANPLHWAQARIYGAILARDRALAVLTVRLTYLELETEREVEFREQFAAVELEAFFQATAAVYVEWLREQQAWRQRRDESIKGLAFPFPAYRPGQRRLAVAAYRALAAERRLFLEAPTGIGKTISVLFPAVKALGEGKFERVFYLTARTVGRAVAEQAISELRRAGLRLRSLTLTAKGKTCVQAGQPCDAATCPLALGYYDRLKPALRAGLDLEEISRPALEEVARRHQVCPFELSLDLSLWVDAVICDYNYAFDPKAFLRRHFAEEEGNCAFLVDEAHNLVDRAREMFSADLNTSEIQQVRNALKTALPRCARALNKVATALRKVGGKPDVNAAAVQEQEAIALDLWETATPTPEAADRAPPDSVDAAKGAEARAPDVFSPLAEALDNALAETEAWLGHNEPAPFREDLLGLFFRLHGFRRTLELYDEHYATIVTRQPGVAVRLFCVNPARLLREAFARGKSAILFSATLTPPEYYRDLLGGAPGDRELRLSSPFPRENLAVLVQDRIRTDFKARGDTLEEVAEAIEALLAARTGNYMVYLPSYPYLAAVQERFQIRCPQTRVLAQTSGMSEESRAEFLGAFAAENRETLVGFAVMGGVFGEGIDLAGDRLIGAIIVGVGLPQICEERDLIRAHFQTRAGNGFEYAYTFPGMNRVLQAIGRVIRSETDRGVVLLIDRRFSESRYRRLFPAWWAPVNVKDADGIRERAARFWER